MLETIKNLANDFLNHSKDKKVRVISHNDTDGITSAAIMIKTLQRLNKKFSVRIVKNLTEEIIQEELKRKEELLVFTDLASNSLEHFQYTDMNHPVFILDHHEIDETKVTDKTRIFNPHLIKGGEEISGAGICYLLAKELSNKNKDLSNLAIIGMIGDRLDSNLSRINQQIINDSKDLEIKKGLLVFSATRPLKRSLEYSTSPYIPGVTGSSEGVISLLREANIGLDKTIYELDEKEMSRLITSIMIRKSDAESEIAKDNLDDSPKMIGEEELEQEAIIGNIYILKLFNRKEDVREISVLINACSRLGYPDMALAFCLGNEKAKNFTQDKYLEYKQELISALKIVKDIEKISGRGFVIMNAREKIKDTIIGTITSMISSSLDYEKGTVLIGMAHNGDKVKVSARMVGHGKRNLKEILEKTACNLEAEVGGHKQAAGCLIKKEDEVQFIEQLMKALEIEILKV